jgi:hypothetical protein
MAVAMALALVILSLAFSPGVAVSQTATAAQGAKSLDPEPDDDPELARLKSALRLMSAYTQVQKICEKCSRPEIMKAYHAANGTVLPKIMAVLKRAGALNDEWRSAVDKYTDSALKKALEDYDCDQLIVMIRNEHWTLYHGRFLEDYKLVK